MQFHAEVVFTGVKHLHTVSTESSAHEAIMLVRGRHQPFEMIAHPLPGVSPSASVGMRSRIHYSDGERVENQGIKDVKVLGVETRPDGSRRLRLDVVLKELSGAHNGRAFALHLWLVPSKGAETPLSAAVSTEALWIVSKLPRLYIVSRKRSAAVALDADAPSALGREEDSYGDEVPSVAPSPQHLRVQTHSVEVAELADDDENAFEAKLGELQALVAARKRRRLNDQSRAPPTVLSLADAVRCCDDLGSACNVLASEHPREFSALVQALAEARDRDAVPASPPVSEEWDAATSSAQIDALDPYAQFRVSGGIKMDFC